jgi:hypothetical protein
MGRKSSLFHYGDGVEEENNTSRKYSTNSTSPQRRGTSDLYPNRVTQKDSTMSVLQDNKLHVKCWILEFLHEDLLKTKTNTKKVHKH